VTPDTPERGEFAAALAREAGLLALRMRQDLGPIEAKHALDFCTEADRAVERLVRARIAAAFGDSVIGEEYGGSATERVWVVDPIDGTMNFIYGGPRWCVSLAYVEHGALKTGAIYAPAGDLLFTAQSGGGAFLNGRPIRVSGAAHGAAPVIEAGWSDRRPLEDYLALVGRLMRNGFEFRRLGSGALGMADVARGMHDGYVELHINAWDVLAGLLLVREAGGWTSDFLAGDGLNRGNPIIACTPEIRDRLSPLVIPG
jgi:myo-inositol-1(or 4)-monophosphatase